MNKISVVNDELKTSLDQINVSYTKANNVFDIAYLDITPLNDTNLFLELDLNNNKLAININTDYNLNLVIYHKGKQAKVRYTYHINGTLNVLKYNNIDTINEMIELNLEQESANANYILKSIGTSKESYDYVINHNHGNTISHITNNCVNKEGIINIQTSGYIPKNINKCICNQNNRIINLTNNKCEINPNLYIDSNDVDANHSALIGKFSAEEMFYLASRGISDVDANNLLIKGFLLNNINDNTLKELITNDIDKYWR